MFNLVLQSTLFTAVCINPYVARYLPYELLQEDPHLLLYLSAVVHVESASNPRAVSHKGAVGLTQLTKIAYQELKQQDRTPLPSLCRPTAPYSPELLKDPETNIRYGGCYLLLMKKRHKLYTYALVAYNGGYEQLKRVLNNRPPVLETANYIVRTSEYIEQCFINAMKGQN